MTELCSIFTYPKNGREFPDDEIGDSCYLGFKRNDCSWKFSGLFGLRNENDLAIVKLFTATAIRIAIWDLS
ncbi:hypothetical protein CEXT_707481 [Caerostris extrusa]|uniref:Uncharacterized protein n=1 Tax=Caerostris extrusa TaxID=172846 RepID=A0AAV4Y7L4_CAEEX|nr:hypothetical protein CEXT_707481 [Caerostris extrusa]